MYAIIETGGKQYKVSSGDRLKVDLLPTASGDITIDKVLTIVDGEKSVIGTPYIKGAEVKAEVLGSEKAKKVIIYKQRPRKVYRKLTGHRQQLTVLKIKEIGFGG